MENKNSLAVVIVDALTPYSELHAILSICKVLDYARDNDVPIFLLDYDPSIFHDGKKFSLAESGQFAKLVQKYKNLKLDEAVIKSAGEGAQFLVKTDLNAFNCQLTFNLKYHLDKVGAGCLVIGGFHQDCCVYRTISGAVEKGYVVISSKDIMYSYGRPLSWDVLSYYEKHTDFKKDYFAVIEAMKKMQNGKAPPPMPAKILQPLR